MSDTRIVGPPMQTSWRAAAVGLALTTATGGLAWASGRAAWQGTHTLATGRIDVADGLLVLVAATIALVALGGCLAAALGTVTVVPHRSTARRAALRRAPRWSGRCATALLVLSLASPGATASAVAPVPPQVVTTAGDATGALTAWEESSVTAPDDETVPLPGWTPPSPRVATPDTDLVSGGGAADATVVVHRGDTLWGIAARHLGPDASAEEVAEAWPRWYEANRSVIGDDPDLLLPGQQLTPPQTHPEGSHR